MAAIELAVTGAERQAVGDPGSDFDRTVVRLLGEHDMSTMVADSATLADAIALGDADVLVDLSEVGFMDGSTIRTLITAHAFLGERSRSLTLRHPSRSAALAIKASGLEALIDVLPTSEVL